jgi:hypothetical protein
MKNPKLEVKVFLFKNKSKPVKNLIAKWIKNHCKPLIIKNHKINNLNKFLHQILINKNKVKRSLNKNHLKTSLN